MENTPRVLFEDDSPQWYIAMGDRWVGPLAATDVYQRVLEQEISWAHYVWRPGQSDWRRICDVDTFQAAVPALPGTSIQAQVKQAAKPAAKSGGRRAAPPPPSGDDEDEKIWYLYYNDAQFGPFSTEEISRFIQVGKIHGKVHAWCDGMGNWERIDKIKELAGALNDAKKVRKEPPTRPSMSSSSPKVIKARARAGEQRTGIRSPLVAKIIMASDDSVITAVCRDISVGGMQVLTDKIPGSVGNRIKLNVSPTGSKKAFEPFVAEGVIVRILEDGRGFSFRFDRLSEKARRSIESYIESAP